MSKNKNFFHQSIQDPQSIKKFLEALQDGLEKGSLHLSGQSERIDLSPQGLLQFSVSARKQDDSNKISLEIQWKDTEDGELASTAPLQINTSG